MTVVVNFDGGTAVGGDANDITSTSSGALVADCLDFDTGGNTGYTFACDTARTASTAGRADSTPSDSVATAINTSGHFVGGDGTPVCTFGNLTDMISCDLEIFLVTTFGGQDAVDVIVQGGTPIVVDVSGNFFGSWTTVVGVTPDGSDEIVISTDNTTGSFTFLNGYRLINIVRSAGPTSSGVLQAETATMSGISTVTPAAGMVTSSGVLQAETATMSGVSERESTSTGALQAETAIMVGAAGAVGSVITSSGALQAETATMGGSFIDDFNGSGDLAPHWSQYQESALPDIGQVDGRYRANLTDNSIDQTLWFNTNEGRGDYFTKTGPFDFIATNIGIGTQADSQAPVPTTGTPFVFAGINIWDSEDNSAHIVVGHRGGKSFTVENKGTINGVSTVTDEDFNATNGVNRVDLRVQKFANNVCEISFRPPNSNDSWTLANGDGTFPSPPTFGNTVRVQLITYASGTAQVPFVGTCDKITFVGEGETGIATVTRTSSGALQAETAIMAGTASGGSVQSSGALQAETAIMAGIAERIINTSGALQAETATMVGEASLPGEATSSGALQAETATMSGIANPGIIAESGLTMLLQIERTNMTL